MINPCLILAFHRRNKPSFATQDKQDEITRSCWIQMAAHRIYYYLFQVIIVPKHTKIVRISSYVGKKGQTNKDCYYCGLEGKYWSE